MAMTQDDIDRLIAGIERIRDEAATDGDDIQVVVLRGPGPPVRGLNEQGGTGWTYSCPYCTAHGEFQPLKHDSNCPYAKK